MTSISDMPSLSRRALLFVLVGCAIASATTSAIRTYIWTRDYFSDMPGWVVGPRFYLPTAATMAALSLLCMAVGVQLLRRRPWWSLIALGVITAGVLIGDPSLALEQRTLAVATIWAGTILVWCSTAWSTRRSRDSTATASVRAVRVRSPEVVPADSSTVFPFTNSDDAFVRTTVATQDLARETRRTAIALVIAALAMIIALIAFSAVGGLQMAFSGWDPLWSGLTDDAALLAWLAIWAGWLSGRRYAGPHTRTWRVVVVVAILLGTTLELVYFGTRSISIVALALLGASVATTRHRLADRAEAMLSR